MISYLIGSIKTGIFTYICQTNQPNSCTLQGSKKNSCISPTLGSSENHRLESAHFVIVFSRRVRFKSTMITDHILGFAWPRCLESKFQIYVPLHDGCSKWFTIEIRNKRSSYEQIQVPSTQYVVFSDVFSIIQSFLREAWSLPPACCLSQWCQFT